ncbi:hypothetical protein [Nocardioides sp.]|uniref:hypothetical protein n=1 Tax=Nocardioides sp. TaxID=35761 RepID=UPI002D803D1F|nr:hypothetical protein [Nocardioides sp.]HET8960514.1 hypothetical protein [Nocardioides sp.]
MELRPPDAPLDAFFAPVRRRHPDVDIVVLPSSGEAPPGQHLTEAQLDATLDRLAGAAAPVFAALPGSTERPAPGWGYGPGDGTVVASARAGGTTTEGPGVLVTLRRTLEGEGWQVRRLRGEVERLSGVRGDLRLQASYAGATSALLVEVRSEPVHVGRSRARALVRR